VHSRKPGKGSLFVENKAQIDLLAILEQPRLIAISIFHPGEVIEGTMEDLGYVLLDEPLLTLTIENQRLGDIGGSLPSFPLSLSPQGRRE
jgi:hypothetical protein